MKADFSRNTFDPNRNYRRVLMQQGRVQVDADWNEQSAIEKELQERITETIIGQHGTLAVGSNPLDSGFAIIDDGGVNKIVAGDYFVDGILVNNDATRAFNDQAYPHSDALPTAIGGYLLYLEVWERLLSQIDDGHEQMKEVALGGADTCVRSQYVWQVKWENLAGGTDETTCIDDLPEWQALLAANEKRGQIIAQCHQPPEGGSPCIVKESGGYRGLQNHLYRVEVHEGGSIGGAKFKWSRDNASVQARWIDSPNPNEILVDNIGRDSYLSFAAGQWIELIDQTRILDGKSGAMVKILSVDGNVISIDDSTLAGGESATFADYDEPIIRRWDSEDVATISIPAQNDGYLEIEDGIEIKFSLQAGGSFKVGDYWLIPARTETADIEWPSDEGSGDALAQAPEGITRHFAPLGLLFNVDGSPSSFEDRRNLFSPLTHQTTLSYISGDTQEALPALPDGTPAGAVPQDLVVGVSNGGQAIANAPVRFSIESGSGIITKSLGSIPSGPNSGTQLTIFTDSDGLASVSWQLNPDLTDPFHKVEAQLLTNCLQDQHLPVIFSARLNLAAHVFYDDPSCANIAQEPTVDAALKTLSRLTSLNYVGGDGQEYRSGQWLPQALEVSASNQCGPVPNATIRFAAPNGSLLAASESGFATANSNTLEVTTNASGLARCFWQPLSVAGDDSLQVNCTLTDAGALPISQPAIIHFSSRAQPAGGDGYPPTVGKNGFYATIDDALADLNGQESINLYLLPETHLVDKPTFSAGKSIKLTGAGSVATIVRVKSGISFESKELIIRDIGFANSDPNTTPSILFETNKNTIENTNWIRVTSKASTSPFLAFGFGKIEAPRLSIANSNIAAFSQSRTATPTTKRFLVNNNTPASLRASINDLYKLNPVTDEEEINEATKELATKIRALSATQRKRWSDTGRAATGRAPIVEARPEQPLAIARFVGDTGDSIALRNEDFAITHSLAHTFDTVNKSSSRLAYDTIARANSSVAAIAKSLREVYVAQAKTQPSLAIALGTHRVSGDLRSNIVAGLIRLIAKEKGSLQKHLSTSLLTLGVDVGGSLCFKGNKFTRIDSMLPQTNNASIKAPILGYNMLCLEGNEISQGSNSFIGNQVNLTANQFPSSSAPGHAFGNTGIFMGNKGPSSDNLTLRVVFNNTGDSANIPSFFVNPV